MSIRDRIILIVSFPVFVVVSTGTASLIIDGDLYPVSPLTYALCCFSAVCILVYALAAWRDR